MNLFVNMLSCVYFSTAYCLATLTVYEYHILTCLNYDNCSNDNIRSMQSRELEFYLINSIHTYAYTQILKQKQTVSQRSKNLGFRPAH